MTKKEHSLVHTFAWIQVAKLSKSVMIKLAARQTNKHNKCRLALSPDHLEHSMQKSPYILFYTAAGHMAIISQGIKNTLN